MQNKQKFEGILFFADANQQNFDMKGQISVFAGSGRICGHICGRVGGQKKETRRSLPIVVSRKSKGLVACSQ
jgi:hypothetical protein